MMNGYGVGPSIRSINPSNSVFAQVIRNSRESLMPGFGKDQLFEGNEIITVTNYVRSLAGLSVRVGTDLTVGRKIFSDKCATCHSVLENGKGNQEVGAPDLTDRIWLYGSEEATIMDVITSGRTGVMPAWVDRLDPVAIKSLSVYVHTLGGGK